MIPDMKEQILKELKKEEIETEKKLESLKAKTDVLYQKIADKREKLDNEYKKLNNEREKIDKLRESDTDKAYQHLFAVRDKIEWTEEVEVQVTTRKRHRQTKYIGAPFNQPVFYLMIGIALGILWASLGRSLFGA